MTDFKDPKDIDFTVDTNHLFREESITDLKVCSIRRMIPVTPDGRDDESRTPIFVASSQLMTPEGPLPLQAQLAANTMSEAFDEFPEAMRRALEDVIVQLQRMREAEKAHKRDESRIIVPGREL
ncbi:MAG: cytoplasmic protein [Desulfatitalea sp.]|nr:cytoplasmic protein [Desulfatitalea sp.]